MAGHAKEPGPSSLRVAANLRRIRQERGLSYAELARRLAALGHPILDTGIIKIEKGERRIDVDDLVALAVALGTTPNRLLLPGTDIPGGTTDHLLVPEIRDSRRRLWAWASGEVPLGRKSASVATEYDIRSEEVIFTRENRPHHWGEFLKDKDAPALVPGVQQATPEQVNDVVAGLAAMVMEAFLEYVSTAAIRDIVEGALTAALLVRDPTAMNVTVTVTRKEGLSRIEFRDLQADESERP
jgi:transcriptional regulator with XRE-family HTH domain